MNRSPWAVSEQAIDVRALMDGEAPHVALLRARIDDADSAIVHLDVILEDRSSIDIAFSRNGMVTGHTVVPAPEEGAP